MQACVVTTPYRPSPAVAARAERTAAALGARYVERRGLSVAKLRERHGAAVVVVGAASLEWHPAEGGAPFFFHPGMSLVRAKRLAEGRGDVMLEASAFAPGDSVVDCTAGLCSDSIVFSFAGGPDTRVTAAESEFPLYFVVSRGLAEYESGWEPFDRAMRRVGLAYADHLTLLRTLPDKSEDIVYFDPMFRDPVRASTGISPLRSLANEAAVTEEAIEEARRVARKSVVLKERGHAEEWARFGFDVVSKPNAPVAYGVIRI